MSKSPRCLYDSEKKTIRVVAAVIKQNNRIFATARGYGEYKGWREFPGGKIELKEAEAARWLSREELLDVKWLPADLELIEAMKLILSR